MSEGQYVDERRALSEWPGACELCWGTSGCRGDQCTSFIERASAEFINKPSCQALFQSFGENDRLIVGRKVSVLVIDLGDHLSLMWRDCVWF